VTVEMQFTDQTGPVTLAIGSNAPMLALGAERSTRPCEELEVSQLVDVRGLVSGDGDFTVLVQKLQALGVKVEVYAFPSSTAEELRKTADYYHPLDADMLMF